jgi:hypothetical protein
MGVDQGSFNWGLMPGYLYVFAYELIWDPVVILVSLPMKAPKKAPNYPHSSWNIYDFS